MSGGGIDIAADGAPSAGGGAVRDPAPCVGSAPAGGSAGAPAIDSGGDAFDPAGLLGLTNGLPQTMHSSAELRFFALQYRQYISDPAW